jgi:hypothetical protein
VTERQEGDEAREPTADNCNVSHPPKGDRKRSPLLHGAGEEALREVALEGEEHRQRDRQRDE